MFKDKENLELTNKLYENAEIVVDNKKAQLFNLNFSKEVTNKPAMLFKKLHPDAVAPAYAHEGDSGMDLYTVEDVHLEAGQTKIVPTGIAVALPPNTELQVRNRSGITIKGCRAIRIEMILQSDLSVETEEVDALCYERVMLGTVDNGYRGEIGIMTYNQEDSAVIIPKGTKLAQAVVCPVIIVRPIEADELPEASRGDNGYGSTDI